MSTETTDVAIVGGGIVGLATAIALVEAPGCPSVALFEKEAAIGAHQTGHNSGVIHAGMYYKPGSQKARLCVEGRRRMLEFCREHGIRHEICGKVIVATRDEHLSRLQNLYERGAANGVEGLELIGPERLKEIEPRAAGIRSIFSSGTAIVDFVEVCKAMAALLDRRGVRLHTSSPVTRIVRESGSTIIETPSGTSHARLMINCAGLHSDRVARMTGIDPGVRIVPFRGEYYYVKAGRELVRSLIYPVPDPAFPFLGVHFTRRIHGGIEAGPNAVLAFGREAYRKTQLSARDTLDFLTYRGFWAMASKHWRMGFGEMYRSLRRRAFVRALQELVPDIRPEDVAPGGSGVRAQAVAPDGALIDDFHIVDAPGAIHVLNAPSPAATASLAIGSHIAAMALDRLRQTS